MTTSEMFTALSREYDVRLRPKDISAYVDRTNEVRKLINSLFPCKKKSHVTYTFYAMTKLYPYLHNEDLSVLLGCSWANVTMVKAKLNAWKGLYPDIDADLKAIDEALKETDIYNRTVNIILEWKKHLNTTTTNTEASIK